MLKKWLISGGNGFIGRQVIQSVLSIEGACIKVFDNESECTLEDLRASLGGEVNVKVVSDPSLWPAEDEKTIYYFKGDVRDSDSISAALIGGDYTIHLAGNTGVQPSIDEPRYDLEANVIGTFNILEGLRQNTNPNTRLVFASSNAPLGAAKLPVNEESTVRPMSPYGASKLAAEGYISAYSESFDVSGVALRFGNVYGPGSQHKGSVVAKFIRRGVAGQALEIFGDGSQSRDFIFIQDLVDAIIKAAIVPNISGEIFQVSAGAETKILDIAEIISSELSSNGYGRPTLSFSSKRRGDMQKNFSDVSKADKMLDWRAKTGLQEGVSKTVSWFLAQGDG